MNADILLQILLRLIPSLIILALGFIVAADKGSKERWAEILYQAGSIRADQRSDPKIQSKVRLPFLVLAVLLLILPLKYYLRDSYTAMPVQGVQATIVAGSTLPPKRKVAASGRKVDPNAIKAALNSPPDLGDNSTTAAAAPTVAPDTNQ